MPQALDGPPVVGVLACRKERANGTSYSRVNDILADSLARHATVVPLLIPAIRAEQVAGVLAELDGLVLPGSGSFVHPDQYGGPSAEVPGREYDPARDEVAMALLRRARELPDLPVLGSCRGMQEVAVHAGCSLHDLAGTPAGVHRYVSASASGDRWADAHPVEIRTGGLLECARGPAATGTETVNSQHSQVVSAPAAGVRVEAVAPGGILEAISVDWPERYCLGVQWHVEQHTEDSPLNRHILESFGRHCRLRKKRRKNC